MALEDFPHSDPLLAARETAARLEQQLCKVQKMEAVGLLAAGLAHDFNNLLTVINGYSDVLLRAHKVPGDARLLIGRIRDAGGRAAELAGALVAFSGRTPQEPRIIDLNDCLREFGGLVRRLLPANIEFTITPGTDLKMVLADPGCLQHMLLNLVFNSRDAMPQGGQLEVRTANVTLDVASSESSSGPPAGCYVLLTVRDTGCGMDEQTRHRIFEPFYTSKREGAGTGLGLPMVQYIVKQCGGFLSVESQTGSGTAVGIYLPCSAEEKTQQVVGLVETPPGGHETILIVEHNREMRRFLRAMLESLGYSVLEAASAQEAAALSNGYLDRIDLLVSEVVLADSTGIALAERLRVSRAGLSALYLCGPTEDSATASKAESGVEFVAKPFTVAAFAQRLRSLLDRPKRRRILYVDDDAGAALLAIGTLREAGFDVLVAANWKVALQTVEIEHPDLVIAGLAVSSRGALEAIMKMRTSQPSLQVIGPSGSLSGHLLKIATGLGERVTLAKPIRGDELLQTVRRALDQG